MNVNNMKYWNEISLVTQAKTVSTDKNKNY